MGLGKYIIYHWIGQNRFSRWMGRFSDACLPNIVLRMIVGIYIRYYNIDMTDYEINLRQTYKFNVFFTRKLKADSRPIGQGVVSPVDGKLINYGKLKASMLLQCKGQWYPQSEITGMPDFEQGSFATIYLSPADYHRVHAPFDMQIEEILYIPGTLFPVNKKSVLKHERLFCRNERIVLKGRSEYGQFYFIFVGALVVGRTVLSFDPDWKSNIKDGQQRNASVNYTITKGAELGYFELGSTVIFMLETDVLNEIKIAANTKVKMGASLLSDSA